MGNSYSIDANEAKKLIKEKYFDVILDVRENNEWNEGHYPDAIHIPLNKVEKKFHLKFPNKKANILIHCRSGMRAKNASTILNSQGYENIKVLSNSTYTDLL